MKIAELRNKKCNVLDFYNNNNSLCQEIGVYRMRIADKKSS